MLRNARERGTSLSSSSLVDSDPAFSCFVVVVVVVVVVFCFFFFFVSNLRRLG